MKGFKLYIKDEIVEEQFKNWFGEFTLKVKARYQAEIGNTKVDIIFTKDKKALYIMKYKGKYYGNAMSGVKKGDGFNYIDIYTTFIENAKDTIKRLKNEPTK